MSTASDQPLKDSMRGRVCLVTGATSGIGKVAALELARRGARVLVVSRDQARGEATVAELKVQSASLSIDLLIADLSSQASFHELARDVRSRYDRLHVLVNNAGALYTRRRVTVDGIEATFALNHLAYFLLTELLLPLLKASTPARIVNVASDAHRPGRIRFDDLQGEPRYSGGRAYCQSKLANVLYTYELARRLEGSGVTANALHPGAVATAFWRDVRPPFRWALPVAQLFMISPERGAETLVHLATSPAVEGVSGKYFVKCAETRSSPASYDTETAGRLWRVSAEMAPAQPGSAPRP